MGRKILKIVGRTILVLICLVIIIPVLLYIPPVQDLAKNIALKEVKKSTGMDIHVGLLRLRFPLKVELQDVRVVEASGDTMLTASALRLGVKPLPLLKLDLQVSGAELDDAFYRLGTPDSSLYLTARIDHFDLDPSMIALKEGGIDISSARLSGARVHMVMNPDTTATPVDTAAATQWLIKASSLEVDNLVFDMKMLPTIDSLGVEISSFKLDDGVVDMAEHRIRAASLAGVLRNATYLLPDTAAASAEPAVTPVDTTAAVADGEMWTITANRVTLAADTATYALRGAKPLPGLDMNYLQVSAVKIEVDSFYNRGAEITVPLRQLAATERCGLSLRANGTFEMDTVAMHARHFLITTDNSSFKLDATMGMGNLTQDRTLPLMLNAEGALGMEDVRLALPTLSPMLRNLPKDAPLRLSAYLDGTSGSLNVGDLSASMDRLMTFTADGHIDNPFDFANMSGKVKFRADAINLNSVKPTLLDAKMAKELNLPRTILTGTVNYSPNLIRGDLKAVAAGGQIALSGGWNQRIEGYDANFQARSFPVDAFMPSLGVGTVDATIKAKGKGLNPLASRATMDLQVDLEKVEYLKKSYTGIILDANMADNKGVAKLRSLNEDADFEIDLNALVTDTGYVWNLAGDLRNLDMQAMALSQTPMGGSLSLNSKGCFDPRGNSIRGTLGVDSLRWRMNDMIVATTAINALFGVNDSITGFAMKNGDLRIKAIAFCGLDTLLARVSNITPLIDTMIATKRVDAVRLQQAVPPLAAELTAGTNNVVQDILAGKDMGFKSLSLAMGNDSLLNLNLSAIGIRSGTTRIDTVTLDLAQHGKYLLYTAIMNNRPGTLDGFAHVKLNGFLAEDKVAFMLNQENIKNEKGFTIGASASFNDSIFDMRLVPYKPIIGYKKWTLNRNNYVKFDFRTHHLDADVEMSNDENSSLRLYTNSNDSTVNVAAGGEDVVLALKNIRIQEWLSLSPFAPPMKGDVNADLRFRWNRSEITGNGFVDLDNFYYGRDRVGSFRVGVDVQNSAGGVLRADASLMVDSIKVITARGALNDSTAREPFLLDFSMIHFPLRIVNPFLPKEYAQLKGMLNGEMDITGSLASPVFNGYLDFDSTEVSIPMAGTSLKFTESKIPVDSNIVHFNDFAITAANNNPLLVNGVVDVRNLSNVALDLGMKARNMQLVNTNKARAGAQIFGKGFIDLDASVKGDMRFINVGATLNLLAGTNITYITESSDAAIVSQSSGEMIKFVQFSDTTQVQKADTITPAGMAMNLDANLIVSQGSTINVELNGDARNKISINGQGNLTYTMSPMSDGRLTGRFTINNGYVRYSPPVVHQLNFNIVDGSYISFTGDMLNPTLNVSAVESLKAQVTQSGQSPRLVDFLVTVSAANTLQNIDVQFNLSTENDLTVQNELSSMSPQQRANQAMNLLLYNTYTGPDTKASSNLSGNPLYSFLTSQLNNWMANNVRGVDISFGIDQYDTGSDGGSTATSYSYRVSKTLFNDRFKIIVGGNYSTDADTDENFSQNLISDISFEYMLNKSGSMYVRLFRHTGFESILEGEVTQTGVGFVYKRKVRSLRDVFKFLLPRKKRTVAAEASSPVVNPNSSSEK